MLNFKNKVTMFLNFSYNTVLARTYAPPFCRLDLATSMGGGLIIVISLLYAPFPRCRAREGNSSGGIVRHCLVRLAITLVVAQFCSTKDHEIINEGAECVRSERGCSFRTTTT